jgi:hypothetical protein
VQVLVCIYHDRLHMLLFVALQFQHFVGLGHLVLQVEKLMVSVVDCSAVLATDFFLSI